MRYLETYKIFESNKDMNIDDLDQVYYLFVDYADEYGLYKSEDDIDFLQTGQEYIIKIVSEYKDVELIESMMLDEIEYPTEVISLMISFNDDFGLAGENNHLSKKFRKDMKIFMNKLKIYGYKSEKDLPNGAYTGQILIRKINIEK